MPCFPVAGIQMGVCADAADRLRRVGRVRAGRSRLSDLEPAASGAAPPRCRRWRCRRRPSSRASPCRRRCRTALTISDLPGPTGGIMLKSATGATLIVNDTGIYIQNGKGAIDHHDRPDGHRQQRRADRLVIRRAAMPGPLLHVGATVLCAHGGQATPTAPNPRVLVSGQPTRDDAAPYVVAGCPFPPPPAGNGPCVTAQWTSRRRGCIAERPAGGAAGQPGGLRADRHAARSRCGHADARDGDLTMAHEPRLPVSSSTAAAAPRRHRTTTITSAT